MISKIFILIIAISSSLSINQREDEIQQIFSENLKIVNEKSAMITDIWSSRTHSDKSTCLYVKESTRLWEPAFNVIFNSAPFLELGKIFDNHKQNWTTFRDGVKSGVGYYPPALKVECSGFYGGMLTTNGIFFVKFILMGDRAEFRDAIVNLGRIEEIEKVRENVRQNITILDEIRCNEHLKKVQVHVESETKLDFDEDIFNFIVRLVGVKNYVNKC